jgi:hypothetical protein
MEIGSAKGEQRVRSRVSSPELFLRHDVLVESEARLKRQAEPEN